MKYKCKLKIHSRNVDDYLNDDLYRFTEAHFKSGARKPLWFIPQKDRGFDKEGGTRRSMYYAHPLHKRFLSYLIHQEKVEQRRERFAEFEPQLAVA